MLVVTGRVVTTAEHLPEVLQLGREHVVRSRLEPGCLFHSVHRDVEDDHAVFFFERWVDQAALDAHFQVPEVRAFARRLGELATEPTSLDVYEVTTPG